MATWHVDHSLNLLFLGWVWNLNLNEKKYMYKAASIIKKYRIEGWQKVSAGIKYSIWPANDNMDDETSTLDSPSLSFWTLLEFQCHENGVFQLIRFIESSSGVISVVVCAFCCSSYQACIWRWWGAATVEDCHPQGCLWATRQGFHLCKTCCSWHQGMQYIIHHQRLVLLHFLL